MADRADDNPRRHPGDKERSRQMSRPVSGKEAARQVGRSSRPQGRPQSGRNGQRPGGDRRGPSGGGGGRGQTRTARARQPKGRQGQRPQARRPAPRRPAARVGRSRTSLYTWGAIALVVVVVVVVVVVSQGGKKTTTTDLFYTPTPVSASVMHDVSHVPASVFNKVGTGIAGSIHEPTVLSGQPALKYDGKPGALGLYGEFCPFCAAERWSLITALSRFGTFTGLRTMQSAPNDSYPRTQTFEFKTATYSSPYLSTTLIEMYGQEKATHARPIITKPNKAEIKLIEKYDKSSATSSAGTIPFTDFGNKIFFAGAAFSPTPLQGLSRATIAASLKNSSNGVTQLIIGTANYMSAAVCAIDGGKPGSVCHSSGVQAAAKALNLTI
jgi:hypothetical protein